MKRILKAPEPADFSAWKMTDHMAHRPRWKRVPTPIKEKVHESLLREQGFICCYCEVSIALHDSHVEHFCPKKKYQRHKLDYSNLHGSCQRELPPGEPRHCGNAKGSWFNEELLVSPLTADCENRFRFTAAGEILPRRDDDAAAKETIRRLCLDIPKLRRLRAAAVEASLDLPKSQIRRLLTRNILQFHSTIRHVFLG